MITRQVIITSSSKIAGNDTPAAAIAPTGCKNKRNYRTKGIAIVTPLRQLEEDRHKRSGDANDQCTRSSW